MPCMIEPVPRIVPSAVRPKYSGQTWSWRTRFPPRAVPRSAGGEERPDLALGEGQARGCRSSVIHPQITSSPRTLRTRALTGAQKNSREYLHAAHRAHRQRGRGGQGVPRLPKYENMKMIEMFGPSNTSAMPGGHEPGKSRAANGLAGRPVFASTG